MSDRLSIAGRKKNDICDFYETPKWAIEKALDAILRDGFITKQDDIIEPCSGAGAISNVLEDYGFIVRSSDIQTADFIKGEKGINAYDINDNSCDVVFTNPHYNLMTQKEKKWWQSVERVS